MKKNDRLYLNESVKNNTNIDEANKILTKEFVTNPIPRLVGLVIILILSIIFSKRLSKLASMTSNAIFGNELILGNVSYFIILILALCLVLVVFGYGLYLKKKEDISSITNFKRKHMIYSIYDLGGFILISIVYLFFIVTVIVTPCTVNGDSMEATYHDEDRVLVWSLGYSPKKDDVIVFDATGYGYMADAEFFIKRVIAVENDEISYEAIEDNYGNLLVNGKIVATMYYRQYLVITNQVADKYVIPSNKVLVLGDNRNNSHDSRNFGLIDEDAVIGCVILRFYPFDSFGNPKPMIG